jgi:hypothetical protein
MHGVNNNVKLLINKDALCKKKREIVDKDGRDKQQREIVDK